MGVMTIPGGGGGGDFTQSSSQGGGVLGKFWEGGMFACFFGACIEVPKLC